jgi:hypothetical protein
MYPASITLTIAPLSQFAKNTSGWLTLSKRSLLSAPSLALYGTVNGMYIFSGTKST